MKVVKEEGEYYDTIFTLGSNAKENHEIIKDSDKEDMWIHLSDFPSGHCIISKIPKKTDDDNKSTKLNDYNLKEILFACSMIKEGSKYKNLKNLKFCYTNIKNIKITKNPGEVKILKKPNLINY